MSDDARKFWITVRVPVAIQVYAVEADGEVSIQTVADVVLPSASEVMEALDASGEFAQLDDGYKAAAETA